MAYTKISVIDDGFPAKDIPHMTHNVLNDYFDEKYDRDWGYETELRELNQKIASEADSWNRNIQLEVFRHPEFFFSHGDLNWNIVVYDWEYNPHADSVDFLIQLLENTSSHVFINTGFDKISKVHEKTGEGKFLEFKDRFEILEKGDETSKDSILDKLNIEFRKEEEFTWQGNKLKFEPSKFVTHINEFWKVESLIGADNLSVFFEKNGNRIDEANILKIFNESKFKFFLDKNRRILSSSKTELIEEHMGDLEEVPIALAVNIRGIDALIESREKGYVMI